MTYKVMTITGEVYNITNPTINTPQKAANHVNNMMDDEDLDKVNFVQWQDEIGHHLLNMLTHSQQTNPATTIKSLDEIEELELQNEDED